MFEKVILVCVSICLFAITIKRTISDYLFVLNKKVAVARIIDVTLPDPQYPTTFLCSFRYYDVYKQDSVSANTTVRVASDELSNKKIEIVYSKSNSSVFVKGREKITIPEVFLMGISSVVFLVAILVFTREIIVKKTDWTFWQHYAKLNRSFERPERSTMFQY